MIHQHIFDIVKGGVVLKQTLIYMLYRKNIDRYKDLSREYMHYHNHYPTDFEYWIPCSVCINWMIPYCKTDC